MNKTKLIGILVILIAVGTYTAIKLKKKAPPKGNAVSKSTEDNSYWTCSMHPQIHSDKPGECPICHMQLIKVKAQSTGALTIATKSTSRSEVYATSDQIDLMGIASHKVEKMTITARFPISGRLISGNAIAFQIYESDLRYIKPGVHFKGYTALLPDNEVTGVITSVDSIVDSISRTIRVVGAIKNNSSRFVAESSFRGEILLELKDRLSIPESSVLHTGKGDLVYLMDATGKFNAKKIILGLKSDTFYEVLSGLSLDDTISSGPNFLIDSEAKIRGAN